jgi:hypothetical protein
MRPEVQTLLSRLADDPSYADRFFADPEGELKHLDLEPADREALAQLDRNAVMFLDVADDIEPPIAVEHHRPTGNWVTAAIALWGCVAFVGLWLWAT